LIQELALSDLRLTADGRHLVTISEARLVTVYQADTGQRVVTWDSGEHALGPTDVSPDGRLLASGGAMLMVFDLMSGEPVAEIQSHRQPTDAVVFSPDGRLLATGSQEGLAKVWESVHWTETAVLRGHLLGVHAVAFSPDGGRLATGSVAGEAVKLWDLGVGQEVLTLAWPGALVDRLAFSPSGGTLMAAGSEAGTRLWHVPVPTPALAPMTAAGASE
jgi:WD40 repeat protein